MKESTVKHVHYINIRYLECISDFSRERQYQQKKNERKYEKISKQFTAALRVTIGMNRKIKYRIA